MAKFSSPVIDIAGSGARHGLERDIDGLGQGGGGGDVQGHHGGWEGPGDAESVTWRQTQCELDSGVVTTVQCGPLVDRLHPASLPVHVHYWHYCCYYANPTKICLRKCFFLALRSFVHLLSTDKTTQKHKNAYLYISRMSGLIRFTRLYFWNQEPSAKSWNACHDYTDIDKTTLASYDEEKILTLMWCEDLRPVSPLLENTNLVSALTPEPTQCGAWCLCTVKMPDETGYTSRTLLIVCESQMEKFRYFP